MTNFKNAPVVFIVFVTGLIFFLLPQTVVAQSLLDSPVLVKGLKMIRVNGVNLMTTALPPVQVVQNAYTEYLAAERLDLANKISSERNETEKQKLQVQKEQLEVQIKMAKVSQKQFELAKDVFDYNKQKDDSILRKLNYSFRPGKLVVVVADFSDGHNSQGIQVANEIYSNLIEFRKKCDIDFEILNGEIKDKVVIRNEQMARDVGLHFPVGTCYAVIWGSISPRTVGMFRPNITFVLKKSEESGIANSYTIDMESRVLPLQKDGEAKEREMYKNLVSFACATIPNCYISYEFACERVPDLKKLYKYLGESKEAKEEIESLGAKVKELNRWPELRKTVIVVNGKNESFEYLTRLTSIENETGYPKFVLNKKDRTVMSLITENLNPSKPVIFKDKALGNYICYMDTTKVNWGSFSYIYNLIPLKDKNILMNNHINFAPVEGFVDLGNNKTPRAEIFNFKESITDQFGITVTNISYSGATNYCSQAGKNLPRKVEWEKALVGAKFDMVGSVDEWSGEDLNSETMRTIFSSNNKLRFAIPQSKEANVGFRGVVRIPIPIGK